MATTNWDTYLSELFGNTRKHLLEFTKPGSDEKLTPADVKANASEENWKLYQALLKTVPTTNAPKSIGDFNYEYRNGKLVNKDTGRPFHWCGQKHYDSLGDCLINDIQNLMTDDYGLQEVFLPLDAQPQEPTVNIFTSDNWQTCDTLLLIIQGSGAVRAGQWARALCINNTLDDGTILPYLQQAKERGWGVVVFNPNANRGYTITKEKDGEEQDENPSRDGDIMELPEYLPVPKPAGEHVKIRLNENYINHIMYVWEQFVGRASALQVVCVAHSRGGDGSVELIRRNRAAAARLDCIAFTDSVHSVERGDKAYVKDFLTEKCIDWVTSSAPLDTPVKNAIAGCPCRSAGHQKHEWTSASAITSVFTFLDEIVVDKQLRSAKRVNMSVHYETKWGEEVWMACAFNGDGIWNNEPLTWHEGNLWKCTVAVVQRKDAPFKLFIRNTNTDEVIWEPRENRMLENTDTDVQLTWGH